MDTLKDAAELLIKSKFFKGFSSTVIEALTPLLIPCHFNADNLIFLKEDISDCLYIIRKGKVEISVSSCEGKIIVLGTLSDSDVFGEIGLLDRGPRTANATAKTDVWLYRLDTRDFDRLMKLFGIEELRAVTSYICFLFRSATNSLEETAFMDADIRIARKIQELYGKNGNQMDDNFKIAISQESLGRMAGLSREATNKALSRLEDKELIKRKYKRIVVPDVQKFLNALKNGKI